MMRRSRDTILKRWRIILLLAGATVATFGRSVWWDFTSWDDPDTVAFNPRMNPTGIEHVAWYWRNPAGGLYIPVTYTYWSVLSPAAHQGHEDGRTTLRAGVYHVGSVVLHAMSAVLVLLILRQLFRGDAAACVGALLFAVHPVQVESVAWVSGAKDVLAGMLSLLAIDQFLRFSARDFRNGRARGRLHYVVALIAFVLAILAKPSAVVTPLLAGILARVRFGTSIRATFRAILPMLILSLACIVWSRLAQAAHPPTDSPLWARPLIALDAIAFYLGRIVWPTNLGIIYGRTPSAVLESGAAYWSWIIVLIVGVLVWRLGKHIPGLASGAIVFVIGLLPMLGFARFEFQIHSTVADHYLYLAMLGAAIAAARVVALRPSPAVVATCAVVLAALSVLSMLQLRHWRDSEALYTQALRINPTSIVARDGLAKAYATGGKGDSAIQEFRTIVSAVPTNRLARTNLAQALLMAGRYEEAIAELERSMQLANPGDDLSRELYLMDQARQRMATRQPGTQAATQPRTHP